MASQIAPSPVLRLHQIPGPAGLRGRGLDFLQGDTSSQPTSVIGGGRGRSQQGPPASFVGMLWLENATSAQDS